MSEKNTRKTTAKKAVTKKRSTTKKSASTAKEPLLKMPSAKKAATKKVVKKKTIDLTKAKEEALSLFEEQERKATKKKSNLKVSTQDSTKNALLPRIGQQKKSFLIDSFPTLEKSSPPSPSTQEEIPAEQEEQGDSKIIQLKPPIIVRELAERMDVKPFKVIQDLMEMDVFASIGQSIEPDVASKICEKHGFTLEREKREKGGGVHKIEETVEAPLPQDPTEIQEEELQARPPIITFMGHVDHGKTSLLDAIRKTRVTAGEAGGITQHIGAYSVAVNDQNITFLDTPGHAAFTKMRARGANITDVVILVVAANDGLMPQTIEAINHAKAANVTIMVAINKIDLPSADPSKVKQQLQEHGLAPEEWGGETICIEVSATEGTGIDSLLEMMALQTEVLELKANPKGDARATVIEARQEPGKGPTATVIVKSGTIKAGTPFICGPFSGKIKSMLNDLNQPVKEASPGMPVEILGFSGLPNVGDEVVEMESERHAKKLSQERQEIERQEKLSTPKRATLENLFSAMEEEGQKNLRIILKSDVIGSIEAIVGSLNEIKSNKIKLEILHTSAGAISENDVLLASASNAIIIGFNIKVESKAIQTAKRESVQIKLFSIIYELIDQIKEAMLGMLDIEHREKILGRAKVKQVFRIKRGHVAGCQVIEGRIARTARARLLRDKQPVYDGGFDTLRRFQDDVKEVRNGLECGIRLGSYNEYLENDIIECYELEKLEQSL